MVGEDAIWSFSHLVQEYISRSLTYECDSYRALSGPAQILTDLTGARFLHGIPGPEFNRRLFWGNGARSTLRSNAGFPSWSWLAWTGTIYLARQGPQNQVGEVFCYCIWSDSSSQRRLVGVSDDQHLQYRCDITEVQDIGTDTWCKLRDRFHIVFWARSAILNVRSGGYNICHDFKERNRPIGEYRRRTGFMYGGGKDRECA